MPPNNDLNIVNPNEDLDIPSWISVDYFKDIVAKDEPELVKIRNFTPTAAIPPGENFTSVMLRLHFDLEMKDGSFKHKTYIFKTMLDEEKGGKVIKDMALFPKEMEMYSTYLPAFEQLYKDVGWDIQFAPKCLLTEKKDNRINFLFEDLSLKHFKNLNRLEGCDMEHMICVLCKLAEFHAASAVYEERNGPYGEDFQYGFVDTRHGPGFLKLVYDNNTPPYKKAMAQWGMENAEEYIKKFPTYDQFWKCALATLKQKNNTFNVLNHGDFWSSNIMFSYTENKKIHEALMVDFQLCKWGSPAEDLLFFITISAAPDIRLKKFDHFVAIYHKRLIECLKQLGYKKSLPSLRQLQQDMYDKNNTFYAFFACINHIPVVLLPSDKDANIENYSRPDEVGERLRMKTYTNPRFVATIKEVYKFFVQRGLFNFENYDRD